MQLRFMKPSFELPNVRARTGDVAHPAIYAVGGKLTCPCHSGGGVRTPRVTYDRANCRNCGVHTVNDTRRPVELFLPLLDLWSQTFEADLRDVRHRVNVCGGGGAEVRAVRELLGDEMQRLDVLFDECMTEDDFGALTERVATRVHEILWFHREYPEPGISGAA